MLYVGFFFGVLPMIMLGIRELVGSLFPGFVTVSAISVNQRDSFDAAILVSVLSVVILCEAYLLLSRAPLWRMRIWRDAAATLSITYQYIYKYSFIALPVGIFYLYRVPVTKGGVIVVASQLAFGLYTLLRAKSAGRQLDADFDRIRHSSDESKTRDVKADNSAMNRRAMTPKVTFDDIFGNKELKARLKRVADEIVAPRDGAKEKRNGILLDGDPGNGKTFMAEALAGELGLPLVRMTYSDVASQWVGAKTERIREIFEQARQMQPCVFFIDEIDSFLESRSGDRNDGVKEDRDMVNALLTMMVDLRRTRVVLIGATNHMDRLDSAGVREGRFDFKIEVTPPDAEARIGLLTSGVSKHLPKATVPSSVIEAVASRWNGFSVKRILAVTEELPAFLESSNRTSPTFEDFMGALRSIQGHKGVKPENVIPLESLVLTDKTREMIDIIAARMEDPEHTEAHGGTLPTGVLFYGPPGTGKTATAKALAKHLDWAFLTATGAELARTPAELEKLYSKAKELRPCIIFVDEADELLKSREYSANSEATNKLLTIMDGVGDRVKDVVWVAATNHPDSIDAALLRGGRFTEKVIFDLPGDDALTAHLQAWITKRKIALESGLDAGRISEMIGDVSVANAEAVIQSAVNRAVSRRAKQVVVSHSDIEHGLSVVLG